MIRNKERGREAGRKKGRGGKGGRKVFYIPRKECIIICKNNIQEYKTVPHILKVSKSGWEIKNKF